MPIVLAFWQTELSECKGIYLEHLMAMINHVKRFHAHHLQSKRGTVIKKGKFLYSAVSSPKDSSKRFTL